MVSRLFKKAFFGCIGGFKAAGDEKPIEILIRDDGKSKSPTGIDEYVEMAEEKNAAKSVLRDGRAFLQNESFAKRMALENMERSPPPSRTWSGHRLKDWKSTDQHVPAGKKGRNIKAPRRSKRVPMSFRTTPPMLSGEENYEEHNGLLHMYGRRVVRKLDQIFSRMVEEGTVACDARLTTTRYSGQIRNYEADEKLELKMLKLQRWPPWLFRLQWKLRQFAEAFVASSYSKAFSEEDPPACNCSRRNTGGRECVVCHFLIPPNSGEVCVRCGQPICDTCARCRRHTH